MKYKIIELDIFNERLFRLKDEDDNLFWVDIITDGAFEPPIGVDTTKESWRAWLKSFVGKEIYIERLATFTYFSTGKTYII